MKGCFGYMSAMTKLKKSCRGHQLPTPCYVLETTALPCLPTMPLFTKSSLCNHHTGVSVHMGFLPPNVTRVPFIIIRLLIRFHDVA
jgi:hypothetical protein